MEDNMQRKAIELKKEELAKHYRNMSGFMSKKGILSIVVLTMSGHVVKNWNTRYFIIKDSELCYFTDNTQSKMKGKISLSNSTLELVAMEGREL